MCHELAPPPQLSLAQVESFLFGYGIVVDVRSTLAFIAGHIPGTINLPYGPSFLKWAAALLSHETPICLIAGSTQINAITHKLAGINLTNVVGYCEMSIFEDWRAGGNALEVCAETTPQVMAGHLLNDAITLLDVREAHEWAAGHIPGAQHWALSELPYRVIDEPLYKPIVVQCRSGVRSVVGVSILQAKGLTNVFNLKGGILSWLAAGLPVE